MSSWRLTSSKTAFNNLERPADRSRGNNSVLLPLAREAANAEMVLISQSAPRSTWTGEETPTKPKDHHVHKGVDNSDTPDRTLVNNRTLRTGDSKVPEVIRVVAPSKLENEAPGGTSKHRPAGTTGQIGTVTGTRIEDIQRPPDINNFDT